MTAVAVTRVRMCPKLRSSWRTVAKPHSPSDRVAAAALGMVVMRLLHVRVKTFLGQRNLQPQNVGLQYALRKALGTGATTATSTAGKMQNRKHMGEYLKKIRGAYHLWMNGVLGKARDGDGGEPARATQSEGVVTEHADRRCCSPYLGRASSATTQPLARGEVTYMVQYPGAEAPDGSDMFIPSNGTGLELSRVPINDGDDGYAIIVTKDAADHLPGPVLSRLKFYGLDGRPGREREVKAGDKVLAMNGRPLTNTTEMHQNSVLCNDAYPRTFVLLRDTKQLKMRQVAQKHKGGTKISRVEKEEEAEVIVRNDSQHRRGRKAGTRKRSLENAPKGRERKRRG